MSGDSCVYPPCLAADVEITESAESGRRSFIAGSAAVGRYLILRDAEHEVVRMLGAMPQAICAELERRHGSTPSGAVLTRFLSKLDEVGILAGERSGRPAQALLGGNQVYLRWSLFNPDRLFARAIPTLRWIWTRSFFVITVLAMLFAAMLAVMDSAKVATYAGHALRYHYIAILSVAWLVTVSHEFAHGLTSKAFGGRATEIGVLLIYYFLPALYCNVSGIHLIPKRSERLWVIAAGVYWQLLVGTSSLLAWYVFSPDTLIGSAAMVVLLASVLDVVFNANPLIKLDGYYFLSQWLRMPNLMDRSRACWRTPAQFGGRERRILLVFGFFSFLYNLALPVVLVWYAAQRFMDWFQFSGILLAWLLGLLYAWRPMKKMLATRRDRKMTDQSKKRSYWRFMPAASVGCLTIVLCLPWRASVGSYGALFTIPGREAVIRAPENATLIDINVQPGEQVPAGASIAQMGNLDLEDQIAQLRTELTRVNAEAERLSGEIGVQQQLARMKEVQMAQRRREFNYIDSEESQIRAARPVLVQAAYLPDAKASASAGPVPAWLAALQAEVERLEVRLTRVNQERDRSRALFSKGLLPRRDLEAAEAEAGAAEFNLAKARENVKSALIDFDRKHGRVETDLRVAASNLGAGQAQVASLGVQVGAAGRLRLSLEERLELLQRKRAQFALLAPVAGTVFGEDLPRMKGRYLSKGAEICRVAYRLELLARVQVPEQALGDVAVGNPVRLKTRSHPDRLFHAVVSRIGGESEPDADGRRSYRVELTVKNSDGLLRDGMTVFARVDYGRCPIAWLLAHKLRQALRPEIWML